MPPLGMLCRAECSSDGLVARNLATASDIEHRIFECPQLGRPVGHFRRERSPGQEIDERNPMEGSKCFDFGQKRTQIGPNIFLIGSFF